MWALNVRIRVSAYATKYYKSNWWVVTSPTALSYSFYPGLCDDLLVRMKGVWLLAIAVLVWIPLLTNAQGLLKTVVMLGSHCLGWCGSDSVVWRNVCFFMLFIRLWGSYRLVPLGVLWHPLLPFSTLWPPISTRGQGAPSHTCKSWLQLWWWNSIPYYPVFVAVGHGEPVAHTRDWPQWWFSTGVYPGPARHHHHRARELGHGADRLGGSGGPGGIIGAQCHLCPVTRVSILQSSLLFAASLQQLCTHTMHFDPCIIWPLPFQWLHNIHYSHFVWCSHRGLFVSGA